MKVEWWKDSTTLNRIVKVTITDYDIMIAYGRMDSMDRYCMDQWSRDDASVEERFMALQLIARKLEEEEKEKEIEREHKS